MSAVVNAITIRLLAVVALLFFTPYMLIRFGLRETGAHVAACSKSLMDGKVR